MSTLPVRAAILSLLAAVALTSCEGSSTILPSDTTTTSTTTTSISAAVTNTYNGSLTVGASNTHTLSVGAGTVTATLTAVAPSASAALGLALGQWDGTTCGVVVTNNSATVGTSVTGTAYAAVNVCLRVFDPGTIPEGATYTYTATVAHY